jgi:predicted metal-binding protein
MIQMDLLEKLFRDHGLDDFKWIRTEDIVVAEWVRFRCLFGCPAYGKRGTCPPHVPSIEVCKRMIAEYGMAAVFHFEKRLEKPEDRGLWARGEVARLIEVERQVFLSGYYKTLLISFDSCRMCDDCLVNREECKNPRMARPGADAMGIDVFTTVRSIGYPIQVLKDYGETMNRYAFLLVE